MVIHNEPGAPLSGKIGPHPLQKDANAKVGLRQELEVYRGPCEPREAAVQMYLAALENGKTLAHHRHSAFVEVAERPGRRFAGETPVNQFAGVAALLNRYLRDAGQSRTILIERGSVAHHKNFRM